MTGTFGRVTVIGLQSPVVGATPVVTTGTGFGATVVVGEGVVVGAAAIVGEVTLVCAFAVLSCTSLVKYAAITPPAASAHATRHEGDPAPCPQKRQLR